jgi:sugar lactone lactonase YvrE
MKKNTLVRLLKVVIPCLIASVAITLVSCNSDDAPDPGINDIGELDSSKYYVSNIQIYDIDNTGGVEDLQVTFKGASNETSITEYHLIVVPADFASELTDETTSKLSENRYLAVTNIVSNNEVILSAGQLDFMGNAIVEGVDYKIAIQTIGTFAGNQIAILSDLSDQITLQFNVVVNTLVSDLIGNDAVSVDADGNAYVSNFGQYTNSGGTGKQVTKITPNGVSSTFVSGLSGPLGSAFDSQGNFYVINGNNNVTGEILKVTPSGNKSTIAEISGWPAGIAVDAHDNLYISNYSTSLIHKINSNGELSVFANDPSLKGSVGISMTASNKIIVGNYNNGKIISVNESGIVSEITQIPGLETNFAIGYITILNGSIYATAIANNKIYKVTLEGQQEIYAGTGIASSKDGELLRASFNNPNGIASDAVNQKLYIVDLTSNALRVIQVKK